MVKFFLASVFFLPVTQWSFAQQKVGVSSDSINRNLALVVGVSSYPNIRPLLYADDDANLFADYLVNQKICLKKDISILIDSLATKANFFKELRKLLDKSGNNDRVFIYFAGHGDVENDIESGFLLTYNCEKNNYPATDAIDIAMLEKFVGAFTKKNTKVVLITDACRSGNLAGGMAGASSTSNSLSKGFQNVVKLLSCQPNQLSLEKYYPGGGHGVFTYHLIDGLSGLADKDNDEQISLRELERYLDEVAEETNYQQVPKTDGDPLIKIAGFNKDLRDALVAKKLSNYQTVAGNNSRGTGDSAWLDNNFYQLFAESVQKKRLIKPEKMNAWEVVQNAKKNKEDASLIYFMELELAAVLEDEVQKYINNYLRGSLPINNENEYSTLLLSAREHIDSLEVLIGKNDFRYKEIHVKKLFLDGYYVFWKYNNIAAKKELPEYVNALKLLEEANSLNGDQAWILNVLGNFYYELGQPLKAEEYFKKGARLAPQWSYIWNSQARLYLEEKRYHDAERAYRTTLELNPQYAYAWHGLALVLKETKRFEESIEAHRRALANSPQFAAAWRSLGDVYLELINTRAADSCFLNCYLPGRDTTRAWGLVGLTYSTIDRFEESEHAFRRAFDRDSTCISCWISFGNLRERQKRFPEAKIAYQTALRYDTSLAASWANVGKIALTLHRPDEAIIYYEKATIKGPKQILYWNGLGLSYAALKNYEKAETAFKKGLSLDSANYTLLINIAQNYTHLLNDLKAVEYYKKAVFIRPSEKGAWDSLIKLLEKRGKAAELSDWRKKYEANFRK